MVKKKDFKLSTQEKGLIEVFRRLGYGTKFTLQEIKDYIQDNMELIKTVEPSYKEGYPLQSSILYAHYKTFFANNDEDHYDFKVDETFSNDEFIRQVRRSCRRTAKIFETDKYAVKFHWSSETYVLTIIYVLRKGSKVGIHNLIKPDDKAINFLSAVYLDKKNHHLYINHIPPKVLYYFNLVLQEETRTEFVPTMLHKDIFWNSFTQKIMSATNLELVEIGLKRTDFANGDQIVIKPKDRDAREYLRALLDQKKILNPDKFNLSYIDYLKIRRKDGRYNFIKFEYSEDGILPRILSTNKDANLIKELELLDLPIGTKIVDADNIPSKNLMQELFMSCCIKKDELANKAYSLVIKQLDTLGLIKDKTDRYLYICWHTRKCKGSAFLTKTCPTCGNKHPIRIPNGLRFSYDLNKLKDDFKKKLMKSKIRYRRLKKAFYDNQFELQKVVIAGLPEINIYLNLTGLYEPVLNNFRLCPLPLFVVNFRGEMKNDLKYIHQIDASDFVEVVYTADSASIIDLIKKAAMDTKYTEKKEVAFLESLNKLRSFKKQNTLLVNSRKGNEFEWLTFNVLSYLFSSSAKWGGKNLPDGIIGFNKDDKKFALWDAKRYDDTKLSKYANKNKGGIGKDIKYILKSISQENTYEEGKLGYYLFVTSNTHKDDFLKIKQILQKKIEKEEDRSNLYKRLESIKFCCINLDELIKLGSLVEDKDNYDVLEKRNKEFEIAFEQLINMNDGYITSPDIDKCILPLTKEKIFMPEKDEHRITQENE
ncbi:MAG: hypothetical protein V1859_02435 [archaeon]